ncbi:MAG: AgmX/PglI C-terminal domain-containing protein [Myxococcota bacterium]
MLLLLLGTCSAGWFYLQRGDDPAPVAEVAEPEPPPRAQFEPEIEIPEPEEIEPAEAPETPGQGEGSGGGRDREPVVCNGTLQASQIRATINGAPRKQVQTCYEQRLKDNNLLQGQMTVLITIASSGRVRNVSISGSLRDSQVYSCVRRVARSWKFPNPEGGCVRTAVPFSLTPKL